MEDHATRPNSTAIVQHYPRKTHRKIEEGSVDHNVLTTTGIDKLPDEMLITILSCMSLDEAGRTSVLSRRWISLWTSRFDSSKFVFAIQINSEKLKMLVNQVLKLRHDIPFVDKFVICGLPSIPSDSGDIDSWVYFALRKQVKQFNLVIPMSFPPVPYYEFPDMKKLLEIDESPFGSLRSVNLTGLCVEDAVVEYFLASCELLYLNSCDSTKRLRVVNPLPNLKSLDISYCNNIQSVEIVSAVNLVSFVYFGNYIAWPFKSFPNLSELTIGGEYCESFVFEPNKHTSYSVRIVKLELYMHLTYRQPEVAPREFPQWYSLKQLILHTPLKVGQSLLFFTLLIKASPLLREFTIEIDYMLTGGWYEYRDYRPWFSFPEVPPARARLGRFRHKNLKVVKMSGFIGCTCETDFLLKVSTIAPALEKVVINTSKYFDYEPCKVFGTNTKEELSKMGTRKEARNRAEYLFKSKFRPDIDIVID